MAKRTTTQTPAEENLENVQEATGGENVSQEVEQTAENSIRCVATPENDGVALIDGDGQTLLIVALNESQQAFGGDESQDLEEDVASPSMTGLDGQQRSAFLIDFYGREEKKVPALDACAEFGWLPSGGEMALIFANKTAINEMIESLGGTPIGDGRYWTSQRFSNERMWSINMSDGTFGISLGTASVAGVRAVKK
jgi:hypothetical protein